MYIVHEVGAAMAVVVITAVAVPWLDADAGLVLLLPRRLRHGPGPLYSTLWDSMIHPWLGSINAGRSASLFHRQCPLPLPAAVSVAACCKY